MKDQLELSNLREGNKELGEKATTLQLSVDQLKKQVDEQAMNLSAKEITIQSKQ